MKFTLFMLSWFIPFAFASAITTELSSLFKTVNNISLTLLEFNNKSEKENFYCRRITIPDVTYEFNGEFFDSLQATVSDTYVISQINNTAAQDITYELLELFNSHDGLSINMNGLRRQQVQYDCSPLKEGLYFILIEDDRSKCQETNQTNYHLLKFDETRNTLSEQNTITNDITESFRIVGKNNFSNQVLLKDKKQEGKFYLAEFSQTGQFSINEERSFYINSQEASFLGAFWGNTNTLFIINSVKRNKWLTDNTISMSIPSLTIQISSITTKQSNLKTDFVINSTEIELFPYLFNVLNKFPVLKTEIELALKNYYKAISTNLSFYYETIPGSNITNLFFAIGVPKAIMYPYTTGITLPSSYSSMEELRKIGYGDHDKMFKTSSFNLAPPQSTGGDIQYLKLSIKSDEKLLVTSEVINRSIFEYKVGKGLAQNTSQKAMGYKYKDLSIAASEEGIFYDTNTSKNNTLKGNFCEIKGVIPLLTEIEKQPDVDVLIDGRTKLLKAVMSQNTQETERLLKLGANPDFKAPADHSKRNVLHYASMTYNFPILHIVLKSSLPITINAQDLYRKTPLNYFLENLKMSSENGSLAGTKLLDALQIVELFSKFSNLCQKNGNGISPIQQIRSIPELNDFQFKEYLCVLK